MRADVPRQVEATRGLALAWYERNRHREFR